MPRFQDRATTPERGPRDMLRWQLERLRAPRPTQVDTPAPFRPNDGKLIQELSASLTWIGHASFVLQLGGAYVAVDPIMSERISGVVKRLAPVGLRYDALPPLDVVCLTHNHRDHLDLPTLKRLGPKPLYVVPLGNGPLLKDAGFPNVVELDWWETHRLGNVDITLVPARHWSMRFPWDRNDMLWGGYVFRGPEGVAYHSGDTALFDTFSEIGKRMGPIDWAMLPIGAYEPRWFMQPQHMNPEDAGQAFEMLGARTFVAMHWGTFKLTDEPTGEPPDRIRKIFAERGIEPGRLWILDVGETRALEKAP
ncbi:MAG: MBL fold metallo-hydrolase [Deltaproteobacteria bacterium]|nr:MBL fold metallo-hydrolase [Deltaproteobacteria bacterium]